MSASSPLSAGTAPLHILRAGTWTDRHGREVTITPADLAAIATAYDPGVRRAPLVVGHPKHNSPAFGWFRALRADGADLFGEPEQVDPAFAAAVREGRYPERSASLFRPGDPGNPVPGSWYLRHVGALGGVAPAVKGLRGADLAGEEAEVTTLAFPAPTDDPSTPPTEELNMAENMPAELAARAAELDAQAAALEARAQSLEAQAADLSAQSAALEAQKKRAELADITAFCEGLASEARIRPGDVPALSALLHTLPAEPAADFAAPDDSAKTPAAPGAWFRTWLAGLPPLVELSEVATKDRATGGRPLADAEVARRARAYHAQQAAAGAPISFTEAVTAIEAGADQE